MRTFACIGFVVAAVLGALAACGPSGPAGGPVTGAADTHCTDVDGGAIVQETSQASCNVGPADGGMSMVDYGDTLYNAEGDDDDCKYHVKWSATPIYENDDVTFTVDVKSRVDSSAVTGAAVDTEVFLSDTHPAPNSNPMTTESPAGTYKIGPVRFDASGRWTVRFHMFETCQDALDTSPHGHAAFFVDVK